MQKSTKKKKTEKRHHFFLQHLVGLVSIFLWMGVIFTLSHQAGSTYPGGNYDTLFYLERKGAHVFEYFVLTMLLWNFFIRKFHKKPYIRCVVFIALLYALSDEFHQTFIFGREGRIQDVGIDLLGVMIAVGVIYSLHITKNRKKDKIKAMSKKTMLKKKSKNI